jgi:hypothetical protein
MVFKRKIRWVWFKNAITIITLFVPHVHSSIASSQQFQPLPIQLAPHLEVVLSKPDAHQQLKSWPLTELFGFKNILSREKDPVTGELVPWRGILLSQLVERVLEGLSPENRAQIDLVILKNDQGDRAPIPRFLIQRYPLMLAVRSDPRTLAKAGTDLGPIYSVVPWTSKPSILKEMLPLEKYFISQVTQLELTSDQEQYKTLFLKRRTDPSAMRGEKVFVQNCAVCHTLEGSDNNLLLNKWMRAEKGEEFLSLGHPSAKIAVKVTEKDRQSILRYLNAFRLENSSTLPKSDAVSSKNLFFKTGS